MRKFQTHGEGTLDRSKFKSLGNHIIFEEGVKVWHPETISLGENVYIGHDAILKGYPKSEMTIGRDTWIGQQVFFHSAGGIFIGNEVGIGPRVMILTSSHAEAGKEISILDSPLKFEPVRIEDHVDIGVGAIILPGVTIGKGVQVGAGAVVTKNVEAYTVVAGNPAKVIRNR